MTTIAVGIGITCTCVSPASAWEIEGITGLPCHEELTVEALADAGYLDTPPPLSADDEALLDSLPFDYRGFDSNPYALAAVLGARSNDLGPDGFADLSTLAAHHNALDAQDIHCLRHVDHDGVTGDRQALDDCWAFILAETELATGGEDSIDPDEVEAVAIPLLFQGSREVDLSRFYFHAGRAVHAIQDSFSHTYRDPDDDYRTVVAVMNWSDMVTGQLDPLVDGPPHAGGMDDCRCQRPSAAAMRAATVLATVEYLAILDSAADVAERQDALAVFAETWFGNREGCDLDNDLCDNADYLELDDGECPSDSGGCNLQPTSRVNRGLAGLCVLAALVGVGVATMRTRRRRGRSANGVRP